MIAKSFDYAFTIAGYAFGAAMVVFWFYFPHLVVKKIVEDCTATPRRHVSVHVNAVLLLCWAIFALYVCQIILRRGPISN